METLVSLQKNIPCPVGKKGGTGKSQIQTIPRKRQTLQAASIEKRKGRESTGYSRAAAHRSGKAPCKHGKADKE
jgi:hypothetical protein